jgi:trehalose-phosphatase
MNVSAPPSPLTPAIAERLSGSPFVALLDIDGTLAPIAPHPSKALVPDATRRVLTELAAMPDSAVVAVSGRAAADAIQILRVPGSWTIGNHGLEIAAPGEQPQPQPEVGPFGEALAVAAEECRAMAVGREGILVEDKHWTISVHYRLADRETSLAVVSETRGIADQLGLLATGGRRVIEIRPPIAIDKGTASVDLLSDLRALGDDASVFAAGDDRTDEDMFRHVRLVTPRAVTVRVVADDDGDVVPSDHESVAELSVSDPPELLSMLVAIAALRRR